MNLSTPEEALNSWLEAIKKRDVEEIVGLYHPEAVLWGTLARSFLEGRGQISGYFKMFASNEGLQGNLGKYRAREYGNVAIVSGDYIFTWRHSGKNAEVPARFSFTYRKTGGDWLIADHHSSVMPENPFPVELYLTN